jgi:hypothetical protein
MLEAVLAAGNAVGGVWEGAREEECVAARSAVRDPIDTPIEFEGPY